MIHSSSLLLEANVEFLCLLFIVCLLIVLLLRDILLYSYYFCIFRRPIRMRSGAPLFSACKSRNLEIPVMKINFVNMCI